MKRKLTRSEAGKLGAIALKKNLLKRYLQNPTKCTQCMINMSYRQRHNKFCGHSCAAIFNNKKVDRTKKGAKYGKKICICGKEHTNLKFCSHKCSWTTKWSNKKSEIESLNIAPTTYMAKKYLLESRGVKCEICDTNEWCDKPVPLILDHIDGNSENNSLDNLRLVCGNCDMQLPTYKSKNIGNGRYLRRQRYKEGKSY